MSRFLILVLTLVLVPAAGAADPAPWVVRVVADDKPAAGATVWVYESAEKAAEPKPLTTDAAGKVRVPAPVAPNALRQVFARDAAGRIGWGWLQPAWDAEPGDDIVVPLVATAERAGRILAADGKPVAGATITATVFYAEEAARRAGRPASLGLPPWEERNFTARSDADGRFKLRGPANGYSFAYTVTADGHGESKWYATAGLDTTLFVPGSVAVTAAGVPPAVLKGTPISLTAGRSDAKEKAVGAQPVRQFHAVFDADGKATLTNVPPGRYTLTAHPAATVPAVFEKATAVEVTAGQVTAAAATFGPAAKVTGRITAKDTGKGLAGVQVIVSVTDGQSPQPRHQMFVETDKDGAFAAYGPAGWYLPWVDAPPDGFVVPPTERRTSADRAQIDAGKAHEFPPYGLLTAVTFTAAAVIADGKPAAGAVVQPSFSFAFRSGRGQVVADKDGRFTIKNLAPDDTISPRVRLGTAVNVPKTYELDQLDAPVKIELSEANAVGFKGRVTDAAGRPVAGAAVALQRLIQGVGRSVGYSTSGGVAKATTDADGRYAFAGYWPGDQYSAHVAADGFAGGDVKWIVGEAGTTHEFPALKLTRANLSVRGRVVGPDGGPLAGVEVASVDGPERAAATTAADGRFTLGGLNAGSIFVTAAKAGHRTATVALTTPTADAVTITLGAADGRPVPPPDVSADHRAKFDAFTRHALGLVWQNHDAFGYGSNALGNLARLDPAAAEKWRDDAKVKSGGKADFTRSLDRGRREKTLFETARKDIDEAVAVVRGLPAADGFPDALKVGEQLLAVDKPAAARLAEEAVVHARRLDSPRRVWALAQAGDLADRAGVAGGQKVVAEAADLAEKLEPDRNGRNGLAIGMVAARLAVHDGPRAEKLLDRLADPSDFNRYLAATAARVAATDPDRAKQYLDRFKPANTYYPEQARVRVALVVAAAKPDEAMSLVEGMTDGHYRTLGLAQLALRFVATDKPRAVKAIDAAFAGLEAHPERFRSLANFGGRGGVAVVVLVRAKEVGHPDVPSLVARALAMRSTGQEDRTLDRHGDHAVNFAAALAMVDPAAARHVLAGVAPPDEYAATALKRGREWLFALALADPQRATALADNLIERAKTDRTPRNALSNTGLVELGDILTAKDRLTELLRIASLPREVGDDD